MQKFLKGNSARLVMAGMWMLFGLGVAQAISNLPVFTGCGYYGICGSPENSVASDRMDDRVRKDD